MRTCGSRMLAFVKSLNPADYIRGILVATIWGAGVVLTKSVISDFPPILLMSFRFALSALVLVWFTHGRATAPTLRCCYRPLR